MKADKSVIITGANAGLGFACAKTIARSQQAWHLVFGCRSIAKGEIAKSKIATELGFNEISVLELDLASLQSTRGFVNEFKQMALPPLKGLVNNAGMQIFSGLEYTEDGHEKTFGTNHLGHFLLTNLLLPEFEEPARIVVVSSGTHDPRTLEGRYNKPVFLGANRLSKPQSKKEMSGLQRYATSKLANLLFAYELARQLEHRHITVNAYDPAAVPATNLLNSIKNPVVRWLTRSSSKLFSLFGVITSTPEISGSAMARLLLDPVLEEVTGKYYQIFSEKQSSSASYDEDTARDLWKESMKLTGLK